MPQALLHIEAQGRDELGASYHLFDFFLTDLPQTEAEGYALMERARLKFAPKFASFWLTGVSVIAVLPEPPVALSEQPAVLYEQAVAALKILVDHEDVKWRVGSRSQIINALDHLGKVIL